jgi:hypothetical protein
MKTVMAAADAAAMMRGLQAERSGQSGSVPEAENAYRACVPDIETHQEKPDVTCWCTGKTPFAG